MKTKKNRKKSQTGYSNYLSQSLESLNDCLKICSNVTYALKFIEPNVHACYLAFARVKFEQIQFLGSFEAYHLIVPHPKWSK